MLMDKLKSYTEYVRIYTRIYIYIRKCKVE